MSSNVGLTTPRGSGTSGYIQRNLSHLKPRDDLVQHAEANDSSEKHLQRQPDKGILEHEQKRKIEVEVFKLKCKLEDENDSLDEDSLEKLVDQETSALRAKLEASSWADRQSDAKELKSHQVHELARAKIEETRRLREALGLNLKSKE